MFHRIQSTQSKCSRWLLQRKGNILTPKNVLIFWIEKLYIRWYYIYVLAIQISKKKKNKQKQNPSPFNQTYTTHTPNSHLGFNAMNIGQIYWHTMALANNFGYMCIFTSDIGRWYSLQPASNWKQHDAHAGCIWGTELNIDMHRYWRRKHGTQRDASRREIL